MTRLLALPVIVVAAFYGLVGPSRLLAAALVLVAVVPLLFKPRLKVSGTAQVVIGSLLLVLGLLVLTTTGSSVHSGLMDLRRSWSAFAGALLLVTAVRLYVAKPMGGDLATLGLSLAALTACGGSRTGMLYPAAIVMFMVTAFLGRRFADRGRAPLRKALPRQLLPIMAMALISSFITYSLIELLPSAHLWALKRIQLYTVPRAGFSQRMWLGSMRGMLMSDQKVLRVHGDNVDHLRGIVYRHYLGGRWSQDVDVDATRTSLPKQAQSDDAIEIEIVGSEPRRYFVPLRAAGVAVSSGIARVDAVGVISPIAAKPSDRIWFDPRGDASHPVAAPGPADLTVAPDLHARLEPLARSWTADVDGRADQLAALEQQLKRNYKYSLEFQHSRRRDPIADFLFEERGGHCEYFASAMALLARSIEIPARVVGGYRVVERNEVGDYYLVRERNAHTWVEAYVDGQWKTFDPTPAGDLASTMTTMPFFSAWVDVVGSGWASFLSWLDQRTWGELLGVLALLVGLPLSLRWWRHRQPPPTEERKRLVDRPLPCFEKLIGALAGHGITRPAHETLEQLAQRVERTTLSEDLTHRTAAALRRYAAWRYGSVGNANSLDEDFAELCRQLVSGKPRSHQQLR